LLPLLFAEGAVRIHTLLAILAQPAMAEKSQFRFADPFPG
jgi:hypothetical protein